MEANYAAWFEGGLPAEFEIEDKRPSEQNLYT